MRRADVIAHFGGTRAKAAKALGITEAALSLWGEVVPEGRAYKIESMTNRKLKVDPTLYSKSVAHARRADRAAG